MSSAPDDAYSPLDGPEDWPAAGGGLTGVADRLQALEDEAPQWADMVRQGMLLAAAYRSGALAGLYDADEQVAEGLLSGVARADACGRAVAPHVRSNHAALVLAGQAVGGPPPDVERWLRRLHEVACAPQVTHLVPTDHGLHDHVLGHGDYKHHPNHVRTASGDWLVFAPVERVPEEMQALAGALGGDAFAALGPVAQASYALHAVTHVAPFAAGNGRVARALASSTLLGAAQIPLTVPAPCTDPYRQALAAAGRGERAKLVDFVGQRCAGLVHEAQRARSYCGSAAAAAALAQWDALVRTAHRLQHLVATTAEAALDRHRRRTDLGWLADLRHARLVVPPTQEGAPRFDAPPVTIEVASEAHTTVQEVLAIDAHPVAGPGDIVVLRAVGAELELQVRTDDVAVPSAAELARRLDVLLEKAVTALGVRAAAEAED